MVVNKKQTKITARVEAIIKILVEKGILEKTDIDKIDKEEKIIEAKVFANRQAGIDNP